MSEPRTALGYGGGDLLYTGGSELAWVCGNAVVFYDLTTGQQRLLRSPGLGVSRIAVNLRQNVIGVAEKGSSPAISFYSLSDLSLITEFATECELGYSALAFSPSGEELALCTAHPDCTLSVWHWQANEQIATARVSKPVQQVSFHPQDPTKLATCTEDQLAVWDIRKLYSQTDFEPHVVDLTGLKPSCHSWYTEGLYVGCTSGELIAIDASSYSPQRYCQGDIELPRLVQTNLAITALASDGAHVLAAGRGNMLLCYAHAAIGRQLELVAQKELPVHGIARLASSDVDAAGTFLLGSSDAAVYELHVQEGQLVDTQVLDFHAGPVTGIVPHPDCTHFITAGADGTVRLWAPDKPQCVAKRPFACAHTAMAAATKRRLLALGSDQGFLRLLSLAPDHKLPVTYRGRLHQAPIVALAFNPAGTLLASATAAGQLAFSAVQPDGSATLLGFVLVPDGITSLAWPDVSEGGENVLVTTSGGCLVAAFAPVHLAQGARKPAPALQPLRKEDAPVQVLRAEVGLLRLVAAEGVRHGTVFALARDRALHKLQPPPDATSWAGPRGRIHRSAAKVPRVGPPDGALALCRSGQLVAAAYADGTFTLLHAASMAAAAEDVAVGIHDITTGGIAAVSFDGTGQHLMTAGSDGSLFVHEISGSSHVLSALLPAVVPPPAQDADGMDQPTEATVAELAARQAQEAEQPSDSSDELHSAVRARLAQLHAKLLDCHVQNERLPDNERLDRAGFVINEQFNAELLTQQAEQVASVRAKLLREMQKMDVVASRLHRMCITDMAERAAFIAGLKRDQVVENMPMLAEDGAAKQRLNKVAFLRRVELAERGLRRNATLSHAGTMGSPRDGGGAAAAAAAAAATGAEGGGGAGANRATAASILSDLGDDAQDEAAARESLTTMEVDSHAELPMALLQYKREEVYTTMRKVSQILFYTRRIRELQSSYNREHAKLAKQKGEEMDKIADANRRIGDIEKEAALLGVVSAGPLELFEPKLAAVEDLEGMLAVRNEEVAVERVLSAEEEAAEAAAARAEAEAMGRARNEAAERALRQMMGGTLASKQDAKDPYRLDMPDWVLAGEVKGLTKEQKAELKEWLAKEKAMKEEKAKHIGALEAEMRTLRASVEEVAGRFDEALAGLHRKQLEAQAQVAQLELSCVVLAGDVEECMTHDERAQRAMLAQAQAALDAQEELRPQVAELAALVAEQGKQVAELGAASAQLDKNFRKEFGSLDKDILAACLQFYKRWRTLGKDGGALRQEASLLGGKSSFGMLGPMSSLLQPAATEGGPAQGEDGEEVSRVWVADGEAKPEGLDSNTWELLLKYRSAKYEGEKALREQQSSLSLMKAQLAGLEGRSASLLADYERLVAELQSFMGAGTRAMYDVELQLGVKAWQLEVDLYAPGQPLDMGSQGVLLAKGAVDGLNAEVRARSQQAVGIMTTTTDVRKASYLLDWELRRADWQANDLVERLRELQMTNVTKEAQAVLTQGVEPENKNAKEMAATETLAAKKKAEHAKRLREKQLRCAKMAAAAEAKAAENEEIKAHLYKLQAVLAGQSGLHQSVMATRDDGGAGKKMRNIVTNKQLVNISRQQVEEIQRLQAELAKVQQRTYPTFMLPPIGASGQAAAVRPTLGQQLAAPPAASGGSPAGRSRPPAGMKPLSFKS